MIRVLTGWSNRGGSTTAFINLVNLFNKNGIEAKLYGPHSWHLDKCNSDSLDKFQSSDKDTIIVHFLKINELNFKFKNLILSSHEHEIFPIQNINYKLFDKIHYVSQHQKEWHNVDHPNFIIPNVVEDLNGSIPKKDKKIGGVIGSIDKNKQTHVSIQKALEDNCESVLVYGQITDNNYFNELVKPLIDDKKVIFEGYCNNKQYMWNSITDVYHYSKMETWGYIKAEALKTGTVFHGNGSIKDDIEIWDNDKIIEHWLGELK